MSWLTVIPIVHIARRRVARLLPLRLEPGRKLVPGAETKIRAYPYKVRAFGYEDGQPVVHVERLA